jgi:hypothetical protein
VQNQKGETPLLLVALHGRTDLVELLLDRGSDIDQQDKGGETSPLHKAAYMGCCYEVLVQLLLDRGADFNIENNQGGDILLLVAASRCHLDVVRVVLDGGSLFK